MNTVMQWLNKIENGLVYFASATLFFMMMLIFADVFLRSVIHSPIVGTIELTGEYLLVIIVYLGVSYTQRHKGHVNVELLIDKVPKKVNNVIQIFSNLLAFFTFLLLGIFNFNLGIEYLRDNILSSSPLAYPLAPALMVISVGIFLLCIRFILETVDIFTSNS